jgi:very-short-patch-repair endonuclease
MRFAMAAFEHVLHARARDMRRNPTPSERKLWRVLRKRRLGTLFRRQYVIPPYIVDFYAPEHRLVVEVDGPVHDSTREYDARKASHLLEHHGVRTLRFTNHHVAWHIRAVRARIQHALSGAAAS